VNDQDARQLRGAGSLPAREIAVDRAIAHRRWNGDALDGETSIGRRAPSAHLR
jgi:hypothetical protein